MSAAKLIMEALSLAWVDGAKGRPFSLETSEKLQEGIHAVFAMGLRRGLVMARDAAIAGLEASEDERYESHLISSLEEAIEVIPE